MLQYACKTLFSGKIYIHLYVFPYPFQISTNARIPTLVEYIHVLIPLGRTAVIVWMGTRGLIIHRGATAVTVWTGIGCLMMGEHVQVRLHYEKVLRAFAYVRSCCFRKSRRHSRIVSLLTPALPMSSNKHASIQPNIQIFNPSSDEVELKLRLT